MRYRIECKGGRWRTLSAPSAGMQTGRPWTEYAIRGALADENVAARLRRFLGNDRLTTAQLRRRLRGARSVIVVQTHARFHDVHGGIHRRRFAQARGQGTLIIDIDVRQRPGRPHRRLRRRRRRGRR